MNRIALILLCACGGDASPTVEERRGPVHIIIDQGMGDDLSFWILQVTATFDAELGFEYFTPGDRTVDALAFYRTAEGFRLAAPYIQGLTIDERLVDFRFDADFTDKVLVQDMITHEIGHTFGLVHTTDPSNVMTPGLPEDIPVDLAVAQVIAQAKTRGSLPP